MEKMSAKQGVVVEIDDDHDADVDDAGSVGGGVDQANDSLTEEDCPDHHNRGKTIKTPHRRNTEGDYFLNILPRDFLLQEFAISKKLQQPST